MTESAEAELRRAAAAAHPRETGGILVGVHTAGGRPWITDVVEIPSAKSRNSYYEVPAGSRRQAVERLRRRDARLGYLGEWHSHPLDVDVSPTDIASITRISNERTGGCERPVLLIARRVDDAYWLDAAQLHRSSIRAVNLVAAGPPLPPGMDGKPRKTLRRRRLSSVRTKR